MTKADFIHRLPFVHHRQGEVSAVIDYKSIIQAFIIAGVTAGISVYATQKIIMHDIELMHEEFKKVNSRLDKIDREIYVPRWRRPSSMYKDQHQY